jgi:hypothetical protein
VQRPAETAMAVAVGFLGNFRSQDQLVRAMVLVIPRRIGMECRIEIECRFEIECCFEMETNEDDRENSTSR